MCLPGESQSRIAPSLPVNVPVAVKLNRPPPAPAVRPRPPLPITTLGASHFPQTPLGPKFSRCSPFAVFSIRASDE
ncbi:MAG: hypothetical protein CM15mP21_3490 [Hyphomicrobiales bacterium]|nr:MAG: hypothetical protein CM15mP21_3490 [Hyphomicrobiales bacterium]